MITLVGCGFLGSLTLEEWAKRAFGFQLAAPIRLIDFDQFEERNSANQNVTRRKAMGHPQKVDVMAGMLEEYSIPAEPIAQKLTAENTDKMLEDTTLLVSALDNVEAHDQLWYWAQKAKVPLLHLGISQGGTGRVEWTFGEHDSWSLSPIARLGQKYKDANVKLKPCELVGFRGLGLNTAMAGAKALGIWHGVDPEHEIEDVQPQMLTVWDCGLNFHKLEKSEAV
jgi:hypothetical protein